MRGNDLVEQFELLSRGTTCSILHNLNELSSGKIFQNQVRREDRVQVFSLALLQIASDKCDSDPLRP